MVVLARAPLQRMALVAAVSAASVACTFWDMGSWSDDAASARDGAPDAAPGEGGAPDGAGEGGVTGRYAAEVLADAPLAFWPLDETSGAIVHDASGNGHDGSLVGAVGLGVPGALANGGGTAARFTGGQITIGGDVLSFAGRAAFSVELWARPTTIDDVYRRIVSRERPTNPRDGYTIWIHDSAPDAIGFERLVDGTSTSALVKPVPGLGSGFLHVVGTYDGTTQTLYVDGASVATAANASGLVEQAGSVVLGGTDYGSAAYLGDLDAVAVYGVALSAERVRAHYEAGATP